MEIRQAPKVLPTFPHKLVLLKGETRNIDCYAKGLPTPSLNWKYNDSKYILCSLFIHLNNRQYLRIETW